MNNFLEYYVVSKKYNKKVIKRGHPSCVLTSKRIFNHLSQVYHVSQIFSRYISTEMSGLLILAIQRRPQIASRYLPLNLSSSGPFVLSGVEKQAGSGLEGKCQANSVIYQSWLPAESSKSLAVS